MVRAFASHARGPEFEPLHLYQNKVRIVTVARSRRVDSDFLYAKYLRRVKTSAIPLLPPNLQEIFDFGERAGLEIALGRNRKAGVSAKKADIR